MSLLRVIVEAIMRSLLCSISAAVICDIKFVGGVPKVGLISAGNNLGGLAMVQLAAAAIRWKTWRWAAGSGGREDAGGG